MDNNLTSSTPKAKTPIVNETALGMLRALFDAAPTPNPMGEDLKGRLRQHLKDNEGTENQPYQDSKGLLTVGVGINVSKEADFIALPFEKKNSQTGEWEPATEADKKVEFGRLSKMSRSDVLKDKNRFRISDETIDANLDQQIAAREQAVIAEIGKEDWGQLTDGQKMALIDIHYANGSLQKFPKLKKALGTGDVNGMVQESSFTGGDLSSGHKVYNFGRVRRNFAAIMGIDPESEDAYKYVALKHGGHPSLTGEEYKKHELPDQSNATQELDKFLAGLGQKKALKDRLLPQLWPKEAPLGMDRDFNIYLNTEQQGEAEQLPQDLLQFSTSPASLLENDAVSDPRVESMLELMNSPVSNPGLAALLKPVENLTESEMRDLINSAQTDYRGWKSGDPLKAHTYEKAQDWHVAMYGDGPQQYDGGKAIVPAPIRPIPEQSTSPVTPDGNDLGQAVAGLGRTIAAAAQNDGFERMVQGLQQGLNLLNQHNPLPPRSPAYGPYTKLDPVKVDGVYGPRTDFALKQATARLGANKVEDALALGRFNDFARNAQKNRNPDGLENATRAAFAGLFRDPKDARAPKVENGVLQDTLNALGSRARNDWQPLKVDDWIGPKTIAAFGQVLEKDDADSLTTAFGRGLGLL